MAIQDAALDLFVENGYEQTTLKEIAERADVAPRTLTHHFPAKHDLIFGMDFWSLDALQSQLEAGREVGQSVFGAVRAWYLDSVGLAIADKEPEVFWRHRRLRAEIIRGSKLLQGHATARFAEFEDLIAGYVFGADDSHANNLASRLVAVSIMGGLREIHYFSAESISKGSPIEPMLDEVLEFAQSGLGSVFAGRALNR